MKNGKSLKPCLWLLIAGLVLAACTPKMEDSASSTQTATDQSSMLREQATPEVQASPQAAFTEIPPTIATLPASLEVITAANVKEISEVGAIPPEFPDYYQTSPDGRVGARADLKGLDVIDLITGEQLAHISVDLPDCEFGMDRYFVFNHTGTFLALVTRDAIQVWQVGGGLVYETPYSSQYNTDENTCGAEIPQLALSPDASLLAVSGVAFSNTSARQYFRVIQIIQNQIVYEWDELDSTLHGNLYNFGGLGFSDDGLILQTFDPVGYNAFSGSEYESFRFWSAADWQELDRNSAQVKNNFAANRLLYTLQNDQDIVIKNRIDGQVNAHLNGTSCTQAQPCDVKISTDGKFAAILDFSDHSLQYHRDLLGTRLSIWNLEKNDRLDQTAITARNLDGVFVSDDGSFLSVSSVTDEFAPADNWWTSTYNFAGLRADDSGISFIPQTFNWVENADCYYCGVCQLDPQMLAVSCQESFLEAEGGWINLGLENGKLGFQQTGKNNFQMGNEIDLPAEFNIRWNVRFLGFSNQYQIAFYCLDKDNRSQTCLIANNQSGEIISQTDDIYDLRFSPDGSLAAYINREEKALFLLNLSTGKLLRVSAYQSRAWSANPAFTSDGSELVYIIQNLNDEKILSLEWLDPAKNEVLRRTTLDTEKMDQPDVMALGNGNDLIALGDQAGWIYLLDKQKGKIIHSWQADEDSVIGLAFTNSDKLLISMGENGMIKFWGIR